MTAEQRAAFDRDGYLIIRGGRGNLKVVPGSHLTNWTAIRDDIAPIRASDWLSRLTPVQQQLLGGAEDLGGDRTPATIRVAATPSPSGATLTFNQARIRHHSESPELGLNRIGRKACKEACVKA
jgi:hypothetical protein